MCEKNKKYEKNFRKKYLTSFSGHCSKLLTSAKGRAKIKNIEFNLDKEWVIENLKPMICSVSKTQLTIDLYEKREYRVNPYNPSIDRIDPSKGYTKENCRIVCWLYNLLKADYNDDIVINFAKNLIKNRE